MWLEGLRDEPDELRRAPSPGAQAGVQSIRRRLVRRILSLPTEHSRTVLERLYILISLLLSYLVVSQPRHIPDCIVQVLSRSVPYVSPTRTRKFDVPSEQHEWPFSSACCDAFGAQGEFCLRLCRRLSVATFPSPAREWTNSEKSGNLLTAFLVHRLYPRIARRTTHWKLFARDSKLCIRTGTRKRSRPRAGDQVSSPKHWMLRSSHDLTKFGSLLGKRSPWFALRAGGQLDTHDGRTSPRALHYDAVASAIQCAKHRLVLCRCVCAVRGHHLVGSPSSECESTSPGLSALSSCPGAVTTLRTTVVLNGFICRLFEGQRSLSDACHGRLRRTPPGSSPSTDARGDTGELTITYGSRAT